MTSNFDQPIGSYDYGDIPRNTNPDDPHMYVDVMSCDGVSTITGFYGPNDFDPVGVYLPSDAKGAPSSYRYDEADEDGVSGPVDTEATDAHNHINNDNNSNNQYYNDYQRQTSNEDDDGLGPQGLGPNEFERIGGGGVYISPPDEQQTGNRPSTASIGDFRPDHRPGPKQTSYRPPINPDLRGTDNPPELPPQGPAPSSHTYAPLRNNQDDKNKDSNPERSEYNARVQEWYNQMDQTAEQGMDEATVVRPDDEEGSLLLEEGPLQVYNNYPVKQYVHDEEVDATSSIEESNMESLERKVKQARYRCFIFVLVLLIICVGGVGAAVVFIPKIAGSSSSLRDDSSLSQEPTNSPAAGSPTLSPESMPFFRPTASPTSALGELQLHHVFNPSSFASAVIHSMRLVVTASHTSDSNGTVSTFLSTSDFDDEEEDQGDWKEMAPLMGSLNSAFGFDVDVFDDTENRDSMLLVGSPQSGNNSQGSASLFRWDPNNTGWLQSQELTFSGGNVALAEFGYSVALSHTRRAVIGAPGESSDRGLVYTYGLITSVNGNTSATQIVTNPLQGSAQGARFGQALDITEDGDEIAVGEPGQSRFTIYAWDGIDWEETFSLRVPESQGFGSSVVFLSSNFVAVGSPLFNNNRGAVQVFTREENAGIWKTLPIITGTKEGDQIGRLHAISGRESPLGVPEVVVGTRNNGVERYDYDGTRWVKRFYVDNNNEPVASVSYVRLQDEVTVLIGFNSSASASLYVAIPSVPSFPPSTQETTFPPTSAPTATAPIAATKDPATTPTTVPAATAPTVATKEPAFTPTKVPTVSVPTVATKEPALTPTTVAPTWILTKTPTSLPTPRPITPVPTANPTSAASPLTSAPTRIPAWQLVGGPFVSLDPDTQFGKSVALAADNFLLVGEPEFNKDAAGDAIGRVTVYQRSSGEWFAIAALQTSYGTLNFGSAIDATMVSGIPSATVGARNTNQYLANIGSSFKFGSAHSFELLDGQGGEEIGNGTLPRLTFLDASGEYGASVGMATTRQRMVVGAPSSSGNTSTPDGGIVYVFDYNGIEWEEAGDLLAGSESNMFLGTSVDMSQDGLRLLAGAPGFDNRSGAVFYYEWDDSAFTWNEVYVWQGSSTEALGTQVAFVTEGGGTIALGSPNFNGTRGALRIYERSESSESSDIVFQEVMNVQGSIPGEYLGRTVGGEMGRVAAGTWGIAGGSFRVFENKGNGWIQVSAGPLLESNVTSIAMSSDSNTIALGLINEQVLVYDFS